MANVPNIRVRGGPGVVMQLLEIKRSAVRANSSGIAPHA